MECPYKIPSTTSFCHHHIPDNSFPDAPGFCSAGHHFLCEERVPNCTLVMSQSQIKTYYECKMKYWFRYIYGIRRKKGTLSPSIKMGAIWDKFVESKYNGNELDLESLLTEYMVKDVDRAKLCALMDAWDSLEIRLKLNGFLSCQTEIAQRFDQTDGRQLIVRGYVDRLYDTRFVETKLTKDPNRYNSLWDLHSQIGTYFLLMPNINECIMEITRVPQIRQKKEETIDDYYSRIFQDIISRPGFYFIGWDISTRQFGLPPYYRNEMRLETIKNRYKWITQEIAERTERGAWYYEQGYTCSPYYRDCDYKPVCVVGGVDHGINEVLYERNEIKEHGVTECGV